MLRVLLPFPRKADERYQLQFPTLAAAAATRRHAYSQLAITLDHLDLDLDHVLGAGHYGLVTLGRFCGPRRHPAWSWLPTGDSRVAVKTVKSGDEATVMQFMMESRVLAAVSHAHIVRLLAVQEREAPMVLVMEYCSGGDLRSLLRRSGGEGQSDLGIDLSQLSSIACCLDMCQQVAGAVDYLHGFLCVHRDIAARNVLVARDTAGLSRCGLLLKLADVGLTRGLLETADYYKVGGYREPVLRCSRPPL